MRGKSSRTWEMGETQIAAPAIGRPPAPSVNTGTVSNCMMNLRSLPGMDSPRRPRSLIRITIEDLAYRLGDALTWPCDKKGTQYMARTAPGMDEARTWVVIDFQRSSQWPTKLAVNLSGIQNGNAKEFSGVPHGPRPYEPTLTNLMVKCPPLVVK